MNWATVKLESLCSKITDGSHNPPKGIESGKYLMLSSKNIFHDEINFDNPRYLTKEDFLQENKRTDISANDILLTIVGTVGRVAIVSNKHSKFTLQRSVAVLKPIVNLVAPRFLMYLLQTMTGDLLAGARGVAQKGIYLKQIRELEVFLPPLAEQKKIVEVLDAVNSLRQKDQQLVEHYAALSKSLFFEMFGNPIANTKSWQVKQLKDLSIKIHSGTTPKGGKKVYVEKGIILLRSQNVWKNKLELDNAVYIDNNTHNKMRKSSLKNRDILMTKTGRINTENSSLGRAAMFLGEDDSANVNGHVYLIRLQKNVLNEFVLFILTTHEYREYIRRVCVGGIDKRQINKEHLEKFPIIYPPIDLQKQFVERLQAIERQKQQTQASLEKSEILFNSLLQRAFKGELTGSKAA